MTIFINPNITSFDACYLMCLFDEDIPRLNKVLYTSDEGDIVDFIEEANLKEDDRILFEGTLFPQVGIALRAATGRDVFIHINRAAVYRSEEQRSQTKMQARWMLDNIQFSKEGEKDKHFKRFIQSVRDYNPTNPNGDPAAAELMAAAARYFRSCALSEM